MFGFRMLNPYFILLESENIVLNWLNNLISIKLQPSLNRTQQANGNDQFTNIQRIHGFDFLQFS